MLWAQCCVRPVGETLGVIGTDDVDGSCGVVDGEG